MTALTDLGNAVSTAAIRNGVYLPLKFMNDANQTQDAFAGYVRSSFYRLFCVSKT